jgi:hypothetical protein
VFILYCRINVEYAPNDIQDLLDSSTVGLVHAIPCTCRNRGPICANVSTNL